MKAWIAIAGILTIIATGTLYGQNGAFSDEEAYYKTASIKGTVTILNHPTLGKTPGSSTYIVFQRLDCKSAIIGTWTDVNGRYQIHVGVGRYRLIVREGKREKETRDVLASTQQRIIDAGWPGTITNLNIEILVPKD